MTSHFVFLQSEWPDIFDASARAERAIHFDPRTSCFYARRGLELAVAWAYKFDATLQLPYQDNVSALIHDPSFKKVAGEAIFSKAKVINTLGNRAVHGARSIPVDDAVASVRELFHVAYWFARTYARQTRPAPNLVFEPTKLPRPDPTKAKRTAEQLRQLEASLKERDEKLASLLADKSSLDEELKRLRTEVAKAKQAAAAIPDAHNYSEAETRDYFIDLLLKEAGWALDQTRDREFEVVGMLNKEGRGFVDYVLWGDDGKPLGLVEAKRTRRDSRVGQQQAKLYADCLEQKFGQRPVMFYSNGYEHWIWDDVNYPPRAVQGFYKKSELQLLIQRREIRKAIKNAEISSTIVERFYQTRAIRRVAESFEKDCGRKALLVMATGAGKTRTVIALAELLMRCNWAKRVLFLADRVALVNQAVNAFKQHLPDAAPVNLVTEKDTDGRVFVSTYPTMMGLIDDRKDGQRRFGVGHFDLVVIDEAHRSVFQKYRAIFDYFDSLLVGLTATPKDEVDRNTYGLFDLEDGVPTDAYSLDEAVGDGFLVPAKAVSVPLKFQREGIKYDDLSEADKEQWEALEWDEQGNVPREVAAEAVNKWLFNEDTVDKVLAHVMTRGMAVAGGDRLGKTIVFAKNQDHADYIADRFNKNYPHFKGEFARVITFKTEYAQNLIDNFSNREKAPHIAISVDMLDTGIDVPDVVNLVFFKLVRSKTKFWQMVGRGTRLCKNLFGPDQDKQFFYLFDYCQNLEYFNQNPEATDGSSTPSLGKRLFVTRLELVDALEHEVLTGVPVVAEESPIYGEPANNMQVRHAVLEVLHREVSAMNVDNFIVRPKRRLVEKYSKFDAWIKVSKEGRRELAEQVAGLPSGLASEDEEAKRFDLLLLRLQLAVLHKEPSFERLRDQLIAIADLLEEKASIPMVKQQIALIQDIQSPEWWSDATVAMLERVRRRLRDLVRLIEKKKRKPIFTDFEDVMGTESEIALDGMRGGADYARFKAKVRDFLRQHQDHISINKLRMNRQLTAADLTELEKMLATSGVATDSDLERAKQEASGLGLFVRSLIGLDREAAKAALSAFTAGKNASQIEFVNLIVDHLTEQGTLDASRLYEAPFTDVAPTGPDGLFPATEVDSLFVMLEKVRKSATAA